jgi:hypothetical protein
VRIEELQAFCTKKPELKELKDLYNHPELISINGFGWFNYRGIQNRQIVIKQDDTSLYAFLVNDKKEKIEDYFWEPKNYITIDQCNKRVLEIWNQANKHWEKELNND